MNYNYRYRLDPSEDQRETLDRHRDICRQVYNHGLTRLDQHPEDAGTVHQRVTRIRDELPELKKWWTDLTDVYSTALQAAVERIETNITNLGKLKDQGYNVGKLRWKGPHEYRSFTYRQSGFDVDENTGRDGWGELHLSKIGSIPIRLHRDIPDDATISVIEVTHVGQHIGSTDETVRGEYGRGQRCGIPISMVTAGLLSRFKRQSART